MNKTKLLASAQSHMRKGQFRKAISDYERVLKEDPHDVRARLNLANLYYRRDDHERAVETFLQVAKTYEESGATLKAIAVYKQAIKLDATRADLYVLLAHNYEQHGLLNEAGSSYKQALRLLDTAGDRAGKLDVIKRILELDPGNLPDRLRLAEAYSSLGHLNDAVRQFRRVAMELDRLGYTRAFQRIGERLLYHQPDDALIAKKLATSYVVANEPHRALAKLKIAFKHTPRDLEVLGTLVDAFTLLGQPHKAVTVLTEMARQYDKSGLVYERDDCYREILTLDPDNETASGHVRPLASPHEGQSIEFDPLSPIAEDSRPSAPPVAERAPTPTPVVMEPVDPPPLPPPIPESDVGPKTRPGGRRLAGKHTHVMSADAKAAARAESMTSMDAPPLPSPAPKGPPTAGDLAAESAIDQLLQASLGAEVEAAREAVDKQAVRPVSDATAGDIQALFAAALDEVNTDEATSDESVLDQNDGTQDESPGFDGGVGEQTDPDVSLPSDVAAEANAPCEKALVEGLEVLDFYLTRTLVTEAQTLLDDLQERYHDHPELARRAQTLARLA